MPINEFQCRGRVADMDLLEWLRTPRYLRTRLMMEKQPIRNLEIETVFLEISHGGALLRLPVMLMLLPKSARPLRDRTPRPAPIRTSDSRR